MLMALKFGIDMKETKKECYDVIYNILKKCEFPIVEYNYKDYLIDMAYDKKNIAGTIKFVFIKDFGEPELYEIKEDKIKDLM